MFFKRIEGDSGVVGTGTMMQSTCSFHQISNKSSAITRPSIQRSTYERLRRAGEEQE